MLKAVEFWDAKAEGYAKSSAGNEEVYKEKLEATRRYFDADSQVFEFGCGTGSTALHHAPFVHKIVATDISSNMIEIARRKALEANITNVEFQCSALEDFKAVDASFNVVMPIAFCTYWKIQSRQSSFLTDYLSPAACL